MQVNVSNIVNFAECSCQNRKFNFHKIIFEQIHSSFTNNKSPAICPKKAILISKDAQMIW